MPDPDADIGQMWVDDVCITGRGFLAEAYISGGVAHGKDSPPLR